jgi:hypothetical protein
MGSALSTTRNTLHDTERMIDCGRLGGGWGSWYGVSKLFFIGTDTSGALYKYMQWGIRFSHELTGSAFQSAFLK